MSGLFWAAGMLFTYSFCWSPNELEGMSHLRCFLLACVLVFLWPLVLGMKVREMWDGKNESNHP